MRRYIENTPIAQTQGEAELHALVLLYSGWDNPSRLSVKGSQRL